MNICIITSSFPAHPDDTPQAPFLIDFIEGLKRRKHQVFIFTQDRDGAKKEFLEGVKVKWFPWMKLLKPLVQLNPFHPLDIFRAISLFRNGKRALISFVKENQIHVCLALWVLPAGYFANVAYRQTRTPYSVWALGSDIYQYGKNPFLYPAMKRIIQEAKGVFADGFDLAQRVEERFGRKCFFLATTRRFQSEPDKPNKPNKPGEPYRFLFVGRIERVKGIDVLLQAMALLKNEGVKAHLGVVGSGGMDEWARDFIKEKGLDEWTSWMGNVSNQELISLYESSDCVVIPSRSESIPLVFSETLNFGRELIVTDVGDMGTLGRQYGVAWVVPPENPVALKEAMKKKVEDQKKGQSEKNEEKVEELKRLFNIETSVERFLADYVVRDS